MEKTALKSRTKNFALRVIKMVKSMPNDIASKTIAAQLVRSATSVGANYRAACRGRSKAEFIAKLGIVLEEADECGYWLELISESNILKKSQLQGLQQEAHELSAIFYTAIKTARNKK